MGFPVMLQHPQVLGAKRPQPLFQLSIHLGRRQGLSLCQTHMQTHPCHCQFLPTSQVTFESLYALIGKYIKDLVGVGDGRGYC